MNRRDIIYLVIISILGIGIIMFARANGGWDYAQALTPVFWLVFGYYIATYPRYHKEDE